jgi:hypothetical protein
VTPRRVLTWTFGLRTPFNPMSDAAAEATRLAPAGRACSKFVWQSRFLKNWAVRMPAHSGRPAFLAITNVHMRITNHRRRRHFFAVLRRFGLHTKFGRYSTVGPARPPMYRAHFFHDTGSASSASAGHVVAAIGRHFSRPKCGGRRRPTANHSWRVSKVAFRRAGGPEFVSEFETKRDQ